MAQNFLVELVFLTTVQPLYNRCSQIASPLQKKMQMHCMKKEVILFLGSGICADNYVGNHEAQRLKGSETHDP